MFNPLKKREKRKVPMFWYKIEISNSDKEGYTYVGASNETLDGLAAKAGRGEFVNLTELLYRDRGEIKEWEHWDKSILPGVYINPRYIHSIMQFKGDPRVIPNK